MKVIKANGYEGPERRNGVDGRLKLFTWWLTILVGINVSAITWTGTKIIQHGNRIVSIEASQFTSKDGANLKDAIYSQLPPQWLKDIVRKNTMDIEKLRDQTLEDSKRYARKTGLEN